MSGLLAEQVLPDEQPLSAKIASPSLFVHLALLGGLLVASLPALYLFKSGNVLAATLLLAIPFSIICLLEPFLGLCWLFAISPLDSIYTFGGSDFSGSKMLGIPIGVGFLIHLLVRTDMRFKIPKEIKLLWCMSAWSLIVLLWCSHPGVSVKACSQLLLLSTFVLLVLGMCKTPGHINQLLLYVVMGSLASALFAFATGNTGGGTERATVSEVNPNNFGRALLFGLLAMTYLMFQTKRFLARLGGLAVMLALLFGIAATQSRGTYFSAAAGLVVGLLVCYRKNFLKVLLSLILVIALGFLVKFLIVQSGFFSVEAMNRLNQPLSEAGQSRFEIWHAGIEAGLNRPIFGHGFGIFNFASHTGRDSHDVYLKLFVELGLPGVLMWLATLAMVAWRSLKFRGIKSFYISATLAIVFVSGLTLNDFVSKTIWYEIGTCMAIATVFSLWPSQYSHRTLEEFSPEKIH